MSSTSSQTSPMNFVIIGAQKSASTFIHRGLGDHPQIFTPTYEIPLFEDVNNITKIHQKLEQILPDNQLTQGIKRPSYLGTPGVAEKIYQVNPACKLICVLRSPIERTLSAYFHYVRDSFIPVMDPDIGLNLILKSDPFVDSFPRSREIIDFSLYGKNLKRFYKQFPKDQIHTILHDDIKKNPVQEIQSAYRFLGVDDRYSPTTEKSRPQTVEYNLDALLLLSSRNSIMYTYNSDRTRIIPNETNPEERKLINEISSIAAKISKRSSGKPKLSESTLEALRETFRDDIKIAEDLTGHKLSHWLE